MSQWNLDKIKTMDGNFPLRKCNGVSYSITEGLNPMDELENVPIDCKAPANTMITILAMHQIWSGSSTLVKVLH